MSVQGWRVYDRRDPAWEGVLHLDLAEAEAHVEAIRRWIRPAQVDPALEPAAVDALLDQRVTIHGWMVGRQFNRRSMGQRTLRSTRVARLALLAGRVVGECYFDTCSPRVPVVRVDGVTWVSYALDDQGAFLEVEA